MGSCLHTQVYGTMYRNSSNLLGGRGGGGGCLGADLFRDQNIIANNL